MSADDLTGRLVAALIDPDPAGWDGLLSDEVRLRVWAHDGSDTAGGRVMAAEVLAARARRWSGPRLDVFGALADGDRVSAEARIRGWLGELHAAQSVAVFATVDGGRATALDVYFAAPIPFDRDHDWIAPADVTDRELSVFFDSQRFSGDARAWISVGRRSHTAVDCVWFGSASPNPQRNQVRAARWSDADADRNIDALIERHRAAGLGFRWHVGERDRPGDLADRLIARGFRPVLELTDMVYRLDGAPPIPEADGVVLEPLDGSDPIGSEDGLQVVGAAFEWDDAQIEAARDWWLPRLRGELRPYPQRFYLARIDGVAVGFGALALGGGVADLSGAGTIESARGRGVYTTLLSRRLEDARAAGYHVVTVGTTPMSRRVVAHHGFAPHGTTWVYEWLPDDNAPK